jgi:hypothetical protein
MEDVSAAPADDPSRANGEPRPAVRAGRPLLTRTVAGLIIAVLAVTVVWSAVVEAKTIR